MPNIYVDTPDTKAEQKKKNPIELVHYIDCEKSTAQITKAISETSEYENIRLLQVGNKNHFDIIQCYDKGVCLTFLGHWNDGVID